MPFEVEMFGALVNDEALEVRQALATRAKELPEEQLKILENDPHLSVRLLVSQQIGKGPEAV